MFGLWLTLFNSDVLFLISERFAKKKWLFCKKAHLRRRYPKKLFPRKDCIEAKTNMIRGICGFEFSMIHMISN